MWRARAPLLGVAAALIALHWHAVPAAGQDDQCANMDSLFQKKYYYPYVWWVVYPADVPMVANTALTLRSALTNSPENFAEQVILGVARNQTQAIAKSIGYMVNANATLGGGCPVPPPPSAFLEKIGDGFSACVEYADNVSALFGSQTEAELNVPEGGFSRVNASSITDMLLAAMFVAGRSCGPPDALSSSTLAAIEQKYINSTCYYAGPIFRSMTENQTDDLPCYNGTFEADITLANQTDPYVAGPLLAAYKQCLVGPEELLDVPSWLYYSFGPVVSIDSGGGSTSTGTTSTETTGTGSTTASASGGSGGGGGSGGSVLDGTFDESTATTGRR